MMTFAEKAQPLIKRNVAIFPCGLDKAPLIAGGFRGSSADPATISQWGKRFPHALIGQAMNGATFALDVDQHPGKPSGFAALAEHNWELPTTRTHTTRSAGKHVFLRVPAGAVIKASANKIAPGIDIRAANSYIIRWDVEGLDVENPAVIADAPDWLLARLEETGGIVRAGTIPAQTAPTVALPPGLATTSNDDLGGGPLGLSVHEIDATLAQLDPNIGYSDWVCIGQAVHHETAGSQAGLDAWVAWSSRGKTFPGADDLAQKWQTFGKHDGGSEVTFRSIVRMAREAARDSILVETGQDGQVATTGQARRYPYGTGEFVVTRDGVVFASNDTDGSPQPLWICSPLHVRAKTRDAKSGEWGRLLQWVDDDGQPHTWAMPLELLQADGIEVRRELARLGLAISPGKKARDLLAAYLQVVQVQNRARCVDRLGWHGVVYVTPTEAIGATNETTVFQNTHALEPAFAIAGTMEHWRDSVAALAAGNSRVVFALSLALAAPLADIVGEDSGGFHLRGASSSGKTTALHAAASVWGDPKAYARTWRTTANGLEGLAALHNDGLLILDELSQVDPREAGEAAYLLANGQGKARATRNGTARQAACWRLLFLSAGEESLPALMSRAGRKATAGQEIRLAEIEADAGAGLGLFEVLHDQPTPAALALALKDAATKYHGAVGLDWLRCIVAGRAKLADAVAAGIRRFVSDVAPDGAAGQVLRVARRFALVAMTGEIATGVGLTGWAKGEARGAARKCFDSWLAGFGGSGNQEQRAILSHVRGFFEAHGASRFATLEEFPNDQRVINRAGFIRRAVDGGREYLVLPEAFRTELCAGFDQKAVTRALVDAGWLTRPTGGRNLAQSVRIPGMGNAAKCFVINSQWAN